MSHSCHQSELIPCAISSYQNISCVTAHNCASWITGDLGKKQVLNKYSCVIKKNTVLKVNMDCFRYQLNFKTNGTHSLSCNSMLCRAGNILQRIKKSQQSSSELGKFIKVVCLGALRRLWIWIYNFTTVSIKKEHLDLLELKQLLTAHLLTTQIVEQVINTTLALNTLWLGLVCRVLFTELEQCYAALCGLYQMCMINELHRS